MAHTQATKEKIRQTKLANPTRYWLGKKRSVETIDRIRKSKKLSGYRHSEETKKKMLGRTPWNKGLQGLHLSPDTEFKIGVKPWNKDKKGIHLSPESEFKRNMTPWNKDTAYHAIRGKNHWNWKGGLSDKNKMARQTLSYKQWRKKVFERDNYQCMMPNCKSKEIYVEAHHIERFIDFPEKREEIDNGITLCKKCHNVTKGKEGHFIVQFKEIINGNQQ